MPVFQVYIPTGRFSSDQKRTLGRALPEALHEALGIPVEDQFVSISTHGPDELFIDPRYMAMERSEDAVLITVLFTAERPLDDKRVLTQAICAKTSDALGVSGDDVFIALIPVPKENFSFGRGQLQLAPDPSPNTDEGPA